MHISGVDRPDEFRKLIPMTFGQQLGFRPVEPDEILSVERYSPQVGVFG